MVVVELLVFCCCFLRLLLFGCLFLFCLLLLLVFCLLVFVVVVDVCLFVYLLPKKYHFVMKLLSLLRRCNLYLSAQGVPSVRYGKYVFARWAATIGCSTNKCARTRLVYFQGHQSCGKLAFAL